MPQREYGVPPPGYRLPDATRVGRVRLQVSDLDRSVAYYRDVLGLQVLRADGRGASLGPGDSADVLVELRQQRGARPVPPGGRLGLYHFAILLPTRSDLGGFVRHLGTRDVRFASADHFVSEAIYLWDSDGLGIEVYADRPRSAWRTSGRELLMTTERLDLRSLVDAAEDAPWRGMPRGTIMGHVHLSVGDLARAREVYHAALGFDMVVWGYPGALFMSVNGYHHHLANNTWAAGARSATEDEARLLEWELILAEADDVRRAARSLQTANVGVEESGDDRLVTDPWGISLRLRSHG